jgi:hypothetical protein
MSTLHPVSVLYETNIAHQATLVNRFSYDYFVLSPKNNAEAFYRFGIRHEEIAGRNGGISR